MALLYGHGVERVVVMEIRNITVQEVYPPGLTVMPMPRVIEVTPRQKQVLDELCRDGADNETIARRLGIARDTVKTHLRDLNVKCDTANRTELAVEVLQGRIKTKVVTYHKPL